VTTQDGRNLGVLFTGYLNKRKKGYFSTNMKKRFVVLTSEALHWFKRPDGYDLFGEERGKISLSNILQVQPSQDSNVDFDIEDTKHALHSWTGFTEDESGEWITAIRSAMQHVSVASKSSTKPKKRLSNVRTILEDAAQEATSTSQVNVTIVTLLHNKVSERVVIRSPTYEREFIVANVREGDEVGVALSNGGTVHFDFEDLVNHAEHSGYFDVPVSGVALASSLNMRIHFPGDDDMADAHRSGSTAPFASSTASTSSGPLPFNAGTNSRDRFFAQSTLRQKIRKKLDEDLTFGPTCVLSAVMLLVSVMLLCARHGPVRSLIPMETDPYLGSMEIEPLPLPAMHTLNEILLMLFLCTSSGLLAIRTFSAFYNEFKTPVVMGVDLHLTIMSHAFISPDAPISQVERIPKRFVEGCGRDMVEAQRRWAVTERWRNEFNADDCIFQPNPHYELIKRMYPHYHAGRGKLGHTVYYERAGALQIKDLYKEGLSQEDMLKHWVAVTEYQWRVLAPDPSDGEDMAKGISVVDCAGLNFMGVMFGGDAIEYTKKTIAVANGHYPERSHIVFVINVPTWFSGLWSILKVFIDKRSVEKVRIYSEANTLKGLQEHIDFDQIPVYYGGGLSFGADIDSCRWSSPDVLDMNDWFAAVNEGREPTGVAQPHGGAKRSPSITSRQPSLTRSRQGSTDSTTNPTTTTTATSSSPAPAPVSAPLTPAPPTPSLRGVFSSVPADDEDEEDNEGEDSFSPLSNLTSPRTPMTGAGVRPSDSDMKSVTRSLVQHDDSDDFSITSNTTAATMSPMSRR